jgi:succinate dehydrogenase / fumarate reductase iron-sulfur subunit
VNDHWNVTFIISRQKGAQARHFESFQLEVDPDEYVLDGVERIWAFHDRSLSFRHACHHSTCGACGMLVNGVEKLTCITPIRSVTQNGGTIKVEPMRNFPVESDLVVNMDLFYVRMDQAKFEEVAPVTLAGLPYEKNQPTLESDSSYERLVDCIECGLCISACPIAQTTPAYFGPSVLAAIQHTHNQTGDACLLDLGDQEDGLWRCHSAFECSAVCPSNVDPGWRIMDLRKRVISYRIRRFLGIKNQEKSAQ